MMSKIESTVNILTMFNILFKEMREAQAYIVGEAVAITPNQEKHCNICE